MIPQAFCIVNAFFKIFFIFSGLSEKRSFTPLFTASQKLETYAHHMCNHNSKCHFLAWDRCVAILFPCILVGLSNILDSDLGGSHPAEGSHGQVVGAAVVDGKLLCKVIQGIERVARVEAFLILAVAALDLSVVARCVRTDQFMPDIQFGGRFFK